LLFPDVYTNKNFESHCPKPWEQETYLADESVEYG